MVIKNLLLLIALGGSHNVLAENILIFGGRGWIGQKIANLLIEQGHNVIYAKSRLEDRGGIIAEIDNFAPDCIVNVAGIIGKPNVDWCEEHKQETIRTNVIGTVSLADVAYTKSIHITNISTGCIYEYDESHPIGSGIGFKEEEEPNFSGSFYSRTKILMEKFLLEYPNVLNLRVKMPISAELDKGFIGKLRQYKKLINIPNSVTILEDLIPVAVDMTLKKIKGNFNLVNPGTLSHNEAMNLYKKYIDPSHTWDNFTIAEQNEILKARRANAELSASKLLKLYPGIPDAKSSLEQLMRTRFAT